MPQYKKNFLNSVVVRIDFEAIDEGKVDNFLQTISATFPRKEKASAYNAEIKLSVEAEGQVAQQVNTKFDIWNLNTNDESKAGQISKNWLLVEYKKYKNSDVLLEDIERIFDKFLQYFNVVSIKRLGLMYNNIIKLTPSTQPLEWAGYINPKLLSALDFANDSGLALSGYTSQLVKYMPRSNVVFNYGMWNPDFPNQISRKEFLLQYDCFTNLEMEVSDIGLVEIFKDFNKQIEDIFEDSIEDQLRDLMGREEA
jgi:uncharacterized protein (TIGR04255 family)